MSTSPGGGILIAGPDSKLIERLGSIGWPYIHLSQKPTEEAAQISTGKLTTLDVEQPRQES